MYTAAIITLSDKGSFGDRIDKSGPLIKEIIEPYDFEIVDYSILPDEKDLLQYDSECGGDSDGPS